LHSLKKHLQPMLREELVTLWYDRDISAGTKWEQEIDEHLNTAQIILLLVSPDFMNSDYCYSIEMKRALERHKRGEMRAIPIILRPTDWDNTPLGGLQALPKDGKAITKWRPRDDGYLDVAKGLRKTIEELASPFQTPESIPSVNVSNAKPTALTSAKDQSEYISAWVDAEVGGGKHAILAILNMSNEPIYQVIVSIVAFQGAGPRDGKELDPRTPFRAFISSVPPGRTLVKVDGGYRGMSFHPGVEIAFVDKANRSWIRKGHGELVSIENNPTSYYNLTGPFSWQLPKTTEKFSPDDA
jgi:hypothetical protein